MKILKLFAFAELPGAVSDVNYSITIVFVQYKICIHMEWVEEKYYWKKKIKKLMERLLKPKLPKQLLKVEVIGTAIENCNYWNNYWKSKLLE